MQNTGSSQEVKLLKNKTNTFIANLGQSIVIQFAYVFSSDYKTTLCRLIKTTDNMHQSRFAGTGRTHYGYKFSFTNTKRNSL